MDFNFGNNNEPNPEEDNNNKFSFNLDNNGADTDGSVADNASPFDWTPDDLTKSDESDQNVLPNDDLINGETVNEETPQFVPEIPDDMLEEVSRNIEDVSNDLFDESASQEPAEDVFESDVIDAPAEDVADADVIDAPAEDVSEADIIDAPAEDVSEADAFEAPAEDVADAPAEDAAEAEVQMEEEVVSAPSALDKKVRTPDGEQVYLLSELIDVETGEPLDLTSLIPEELLAAAAAPATAGGFSMGVSEPTTSGFSMGSAQPAEGGFDMSAGEEAPTTSKRKRPARPKTEKKKGGGIVGVIMGGLLAVILFPYVMAIIEMCGVESNFPVPAPFIPTSYKHIPDWWPEWAMFLFPGRTTDKATDAPADQPAKNPEPAVPEENANPADDSAVPEENANPADDSAAEEETPADNAAAAEDGAFDADAFLGNDGGDNDAQPEESPADEPVADEPVEPGVIDAPQYTSADVSEAVAAVETAITAAKKIDDTVYAALNDMAEKSTFVDTKKADAALVESMDKVKKAMGKFGTKANLASVLSAKWAARVEDASDNAGVLFVGTLTEVSERDGYQINTITVEGQDGAVEVVGLRKIKPVVGDKIVVCGKRIADPAKNLGGFTDNGKPVIWGGIVIKAEKTNK